MAEIRFKAKPLEEDSNRCGEICQSAVADSVSVKASPAYDIFHTYFSENFANQCCVAFEKCLEQIEEIRLRLGKEICVKAAGKEYWMANEPLGRQEFERILSKMNQSSLYAWEEEYKKGYLTLAGGHRVGMVGKTILKDGQVRTMRDISSLNIRLARNSYGAAAGLEEYMITNGTIKDTLLVGPPGSGKTTLLREMIRLLSDGLWGKGYSVAVVDERSEIAGMFHGVAQLDVGKRTDVLDGCHKGEGMIMMLRAMAPEVLAVDELATLEDIHGIQMAIGSGVAVLGTAHGESLHDLYRRTALGEVLQKGYFINLIFLNHRNSHNKIAAVYVYGAQGYERVR